MGVGDFSVGLTVSGVVSFRVLVCLIGARGCWVVFLPVVEYENVIE